MLLPGLLHIPSGFHSRARAPGDGGHSMVSPSLVEGLHVEAHVRALRHATGAHGFHVATHSRSTRDDAVQLERMPTACSNAMRQDKRH